MALLGLLLLPLNFRGGDDASHGHSLLHLWADAADGMIDHHHHATHVSQGESLDWLNPEASVEALGATDGQQNQVPDVGEHDDSMPNPGTIHLLAAALPALIAPRASHESPIQRDALPTGRNPEVLIPPPRTIVLAA
jgi:hypothetical protein